MLFALATLAFLLPLAMAAPGGSSMGGVYLVRPSSSSFQLSWQHNIIVKEYHRITSNGAVIPSLYPRFHCFPHFADEQERWWLRLCILFWWTNWWDPISGAAICSQHFIESAPFWLRMGPIQWNLSWCWSATLCKVTSTVTMMLQTSAKAKKVRFDEKCPLTSLWCDVLGGLQRGLQGWLWRRHRKSSTTWKTRSQCQLWPSLLQPGPLWLPKLPRLFLRILVFCSILPILLIVEIWSKILMSRSITSL